MRPVYISAAAIALAALTLAAIPPQKADDQKAADPGVLTLVVSVAPAGPYQLLSLKGATMPIRAEALVMPYGETMIIAHARIDMAAGQKRHTSKTNGAYTVDLTASVNRDATGATTSAKVYRAGEVVAAQESTVSLPRGITYKNEPAQ